MGIGKVKVGDPEAAGAGLGQNLQASSHQIGAIQGQVIAVGEGRKHGSGKGPVARAEFRCVKFLIRLCRDQPANGLDLLLPPGDEKGAVAEEDLGVVLLPGCIGDTVG